jgi:lipoprotein NlpD
MPLDKGFRLCWVLLGALLVGCAGQQSTAPVSSRGLSGSQDRTTSARPAFHKVLAGETLYSISWRYGYDYREVAGWNGIGPPYRIYPGQRIVLTPPATLRTPVVAASPRKPPPQLEPIVGPLSGVNAPTPIPDTLDSVSAPNRWIWPTGGKIIGSFSSGEKGLRIAGNEGQPVQAAAPGRVVYSGSGLVGLGELIIVKHDKSFLSAYAHNKKLLVMEGDQVISGQPIGQMGKSGADQVMLYFEIRKDGKPVDPLQYLPPR